MASKEKVFFDSEKGQYKIIFTNGKGDEQTRDTVSVIHPMNQTDAVNVFLGLAKEAVNKRTAAVTLLAMILSQELKSLEEWQGKCDRTKQLPNELKTAFQDAETAFFKPMMDDKHPQHKGFVGRLSKVNERGEPLESDGKPNRQAQFQYFMTVTRRDPSYANAKNTVLGYFGYVGSLPYTEKGDIVPPEIMRVLVNEVRDIKAPDNSYKARLYEMYREVVVESKNPPDADLPEIARTARELAEHLKTLADAAARRATETVKPGDVVAQTKEAMEKANAGIPANAPTAGKVKKAEETH